MPRGGNRGTGADFLRLQTAGAFALDESALCVAIEMADEAIRMLSLPRQRYASLVAMLYDGVCQRMSYAHLLDFARSWAREMADEPEVAAQVPSRMAGTGR
jgi:hypothetical protein